MPGYSIGLLETKKYSIALNALDSMLKTSKVNALDKKVITDDFVTIFIEGEISAVRSALDVGILKIKREGEMCSTYLLDDPDPVLTNLI